MAMSAAHRAAISAGMKRYWASRKGSSGGGGSSVPVSYLPGPHPAKVPKATKRSGSPKQPAINKINAPSRPVINVSTGKVISREEAAARMFGSAAARKKATGKKRR